MAADAKQGDQEQKNLLDEIRKRAEAAELARIEVEEEKLSRSFSDAPPPPATDLHAKPKTERDSTDQHEQPSNVPSNDQAGKTPETSGSFGPLHSSSLIADNSQPQALESEQGRPTKTLHAPTGLESARSQQRIEGLLESARKNYEREEYERALQELDELLALDSQNRNALLFRIDVEKAKTLSERIRDDEERRRKIDDEEAAKNVFIPPPRRMKDEPPLAVPEPAVKEDAFFPDKKAEPATPVAPPPTNSRSLKWIAFGVLAALGITTAAVLFDSVRERFFPKKISILVLAPATSGIEHYVADGLLDDLIRHLSHLQTLRVFSTTTAFAVRNSDGLKLAKTFGADYVLQWSASQVDGEMNVNFALIDAASSKRTLDQSLKISGNKRTDFYRTVVPAVAKTLGVDARDADNVFGRSQPNSDSYDAYLLGRYLLRHSERVPLDSIAAVFDISRQRDPSYPHAEAALGWTNILIHNALADTSNLYLEQAAKNLRRAMNLGASSSEVYSLWGAIEFFRARFPQAVERLKQATTIAPSDPEAHRWLTIAYLRMGRNNDALDAARIAVETDPRSHQSRSMLGMAYLMNGDPNAALREFEESTRWSVDSSTMYSNEYLAVLVATNRHERALDILKDRARMHPSDFILHYDLGRMLQLAGKSKSEWQSSLLIAKQLIDDTLKFDPHNALVLSYLGLVATRLGQFEEGIKATKQAYAIAPTDIVVLYNSARMLALQRDRTKEALSSFAHAVQRRFVVEYVLDLDLVTLRNLPQFVRNLEQ